MCCSDCWYLYALNPLDRFLSGRIDVEPDQTIEILMTELDPKVMQMFTKSKAANGKDATMVIVQRLQSIFLYFVWLHFFPTIISNIKFVIYLLSIYIYKSLCRRKKIRNRKKKEQQKLFFYI